MGQDNPHHLPQGLRLYCIGDIHGRLDLLQQVAGRIAQDLKHRAPEHARIILLGDYIDRGPHSAQVIDMLAEDQLPAPVACLRGNHEDLLDAFLQDSERMEDWRRVGGLETLASYGIDTDSVAAGHGYAEARHALFHVMPSEHRRFLKELQLSFAIGPYFFCHAGVRPGIALHQQSAHDLMWIREPFLSSTEHYGRIIIHGHTPVRAPDFRTNRINLDTGAVLSGHLTCLALEGEDMQLI